MYIRTGNEGPLSCCTASSVAKPTDRRRKKRIERFAVALGRPRTAPLHAPCPAVRGASAPGLWVSDIIRPSPEHRLCALLGTEFHRPRLPPPLPPPPPPLLHLFSTSTTPGKEEGLSVIRQPKVSDCCLVLSFLIPSSSPPFILPKAPGFPSQLSLLPWETRLWRRGYCRCCCLAAVAACTESPSICISYHAGPPARCYPAAA